VLLNKEADRTLFEFTQLWRSLCW